MAVRSYVLIPRFILDDPKWALLSAEEWVAKFMAIVDNRDNWHYERSRSPERLAWESMRKCMTEKVFARDEHLCRNCGSTQRLEIDHIHPLSRGGSNDLDNLQILCRCCNSKKGNRLPKEM